MAKVAPEDLFRGHSFRTGVNSLADPEGKNASEYQQKKKQFIRIYDKISGRAF